MESGLIVTNPSLDPLIFRDSKRLYGPNQGGNFGNQSGNLYFDLKMLFLG